MRSAFAVKFYRDGTVTLWNVYTQTRDRTGSPSDQVLASLPASEREKVIEHCDKGKGNSYRYTTDGESGNIRAQSFEAACEQLKAMVVGSNGGWGWVEDSDGYRYEIEA